MQKKKMLHYTDKYLAHILVKCYVPLFCLKLLNESMGLKTIREIQSIPCALIMN